MSAFTYRPDPLDDLPARAAASLPDMAMLPMLARRIQVARRSGPLHPQLSFDIDTLVEGIEKAIDLAEAGHESEAFDQSLAHLRQLAASIDARLGERFAAVAADLEMQSGVAVQDLESVAPLDATTAWAALAAIATPSLPEKLGDAVPPVILRTGFDDEDCGRVSGTFHVMQDICGSSPVGPIESVVVPVNAYLRLEPGEIFILHVSGFVYGDQNDYPEKNKRPSILHLLAGEEGALVHGPAVIQRVQKDGTLNLEMRTLRNKLVSMPAGKSCPVSWVITCSAGLTSAFAAAANGMDKPDGRAIVLLGMIAFGLGVLNAFGLLLLRALFLNRNDSLSDGRIWFGRQKTSTALKAREMERRLNEVTCNLGLQEAGRSRYRLRIGRFMARSSHDLEAIPGKVRTGLNFIPLTRALAMSGAETLRVLEPLKALPAPDPVEMDGKVVRLDPARR